MKTDLRLTDIKSNAYICINAKFDILKREIRALPISSEFVFSERERLVNEFKYFLQDLVFIGLIDDDFSKKYLEKLEFTPSYFIKY